MTTFDDRTRRTARPATATPALLASALGGVSALGFIAGLILIGDAVLRRCGR